MARPRDSIPKPRNLYWSAMSLLGLGLGLGVILILESGIGEVGRPKIGMLMPGIMLATMAFIFLFGVIYEKGRHHLSVHFRVQTNRGSVDDELVVPVPKNQIPLVEKTIEGWGRI